MKKDRGLTVLEIIVSCVIIFILTGAGSACFKNTIRAFKEAALKNQLMDIRFNVKLYQLLRNKNPEDLRALLTEEADFMPYSGRPFKKKYLEFVRSDKEGFPVDPFGNRFIYRSDTGEVRSGTNGYKTW